MGISEVGFTLRIVLANPLFFVLDVALSLKARWLGILGLKRGVAYFLFLRRLRLKLAALMT